MSRIGGAFPFPTAQVVEGGGVIVLPSGGVFYPPPGQYVFSTGGTTVLQWFDPILQTWRAVASPTSAMDYVNTDGYNFRFINLSGVVVGASITAAGSAGTNGIGATATGVSVAFTGPTAGITATGYAIVGGSVAAPTITQAGSGFLVPPAIVIDPPPPGGIQATAVATLSAGTITAITMVNVGAGYASTPNFYVIPQVGLYAGGASGSFAAGGLPPPGLVFPANAVPGNQNTSATGVQLTSIALTGSGTLTGINIVNNGTNYSGTTIPTISITGMTAATATAVMSFVLNSVTLTAAGAGYGAGAAPNFVTSLGLVATSWNNSDLNPIAASGVTTLSGGGVATFVVENPGFGLQKVPIVSVLNTSALASAQATGTAVVGGATDTTILQPRVQ